MHWINWNEIKQCSLAALIFSKKQNEEKRKKNKKKSNQTHTTLNNNCVYSSFSAFLWCGAWLHKFNQNKSVHHSLSDRSHECIVCTSSSKHSLFVICHNLYSRLPLYAVNTLNSWSWHGLFISVEYIYFFDSWHLTGNECTVANIGHKSKQTMITCNDWMSMKRNTEQRSVWKICAVNWYEDWMQKECVCVRFILSALYFRAN